MRKTRKKISIKLSASAKLPTAFGAFTIHIFTDQAGREHVALTKGNIATHLPVLTRVHSQCLTGDTFQSLKCDCVNQLHSALKKISHARRGVLIYLNQEGRGIGLHNKIRAYALQEKGMDTVEANLALGFSADERDYQVAAKILKALSISHIKLLTNNPDKIAQLKTYGITVVRRIPLAVGKNRLNRRYLDVKAKKLGHRFET